MPASLRALEKHANFAGNLQNDARHRALWERLRGDRLGPSIPTVPPTGSSYPVGMTGQMPGSLPVQLTGSPGPVPGMSIREMLDLRAYKAMVESFERPPPAPPPPAVDLSALLALQARAPADSGAVAEVAALRREIAEKDRALMESRFRSIEEKIERAFSGGNGTEGEPEGSGGTWKAVAAGLAAGFAPFVLQKAGPYIERAMGGGVPALPAPAQFEKCGCGLLKAPGVQHVSPMCDPTPHVPPDAPPAAQMCVCGSSVWVAGHCGSCGRPG